ncbi:MAG: 6-phosphogluconolactonase [Frankiales bacterium]|nr:6-phosphogluconolactonase [Frankiales bacterium]
MIVSVHDDLATDVAALLIERLASVQATQGSASVVLTGGGVGIAALEAVRRSPGEVDWARVDVWWGDERFVARDSEDRNELQARQALLDHLPFDPARVHPMGWDDGTITADEAASVYAASLPAAFDVLLLGVGPEGHVASIFPDSPAAVDERRAFGVHDCPKPPPTRVSLGFSAIQSAAAVWVIASGEGKADALAAARTASQVELPVAGARGTAETRWLLDEAAASRLPVER